LNYARLTARHKPDQYSINLINPNPHQQNL